MLAFKCFLFAVVGLGLEVIETAVLDYPSKKDSRLMGYSSMWYLPFYAVCPLAYFHYFHSWLFARPLTLRAVLYMLSFWIVEYLSMGLLRLLLGRSPSEESYYQSRWNVQGLIRLDLGPVWIVFGLVFEWMYRSLAPL
ncbi:MAG: hypothetical protein HY078_03505 [Elusimicrobia bacterium]|nr:hypothetical protein [Elusimicrobiota bacterium]